MKKFICSVLVIVCSLSLIVIFLDCTFEKNALGAESEFPENLLSQEIEPDGMFSIEGTRWYVGPIRSQPYCIPFCSLGFYEGNIYMENESEPFDIGIYFDLLLVSPFVGVFFLENFTIITLGVMQPVIGYGVDITFMIGEDVIPIPFIRSWYKVSDSWTHE